MTQHVQVSKVVGESTIGLALAGLGLWWASQAYELGLVQYGEIGPGAFPFGIGLLLAIGGIGCVIRSILLLRAAGGFSGAVSLEVAAFKLFGLTGCFAVLFVWVSPVLALILFVSVMLIWLGQQGIIRSIFAGVIISVLLYVIFDRLLGVQLPTDHLVLVTGL